MKNDEFNRIMQKRIDQVTSTMTTKSAEYTRTDRLENLKKIASLCQMTTEKATFTLVAKHIVALNEFIEDLDRGTVQPADRWDEKIGDVIAYMLLLDAAVAERLKRGMPGMELNETGIAQVNEIMGVDPRLQDPERNPYIREFDALMQQPNNQQQ